MTLFDECREALSADFNIVERQRGKEVINLLRKYPFSAGNITWAEMETFDYESIDELLHKNIIKDDVVFVYADDANIPIFKSNLGLIAKNIYDVTALSPKLFLFNEKIIIQPLFPTEMFRLGMKTNDV